MLAFFFISEQNNVSEPDDGILASMDKYKHLEDTTFKKNFMDILSQNIQSKLEKAVRHNMVCTKTIYAFKFSSLQVESVFLIALSVNAKSFLNSY